jgi:hypothetical protein
VIYRVPLVQTVAYFPTLKVKVLRLAGWRIFANDANLLCIARQRLVFLFYYMFIFVILSWSYKLLETNNSLKIFHKFGVCLQSVMRSRIGTSSSEVQSPRWSHIFHLPPSWFMDIGTSCPKILYLHFIQSTKCFTWNGLVMDKKNMLEETSEKISLCGLCIVEN